MVLFSALTNESLRRGLIVKKKNSDPDNGDGQEDDELTDQQKNLLTLVVLLELLALIYAVMLAVRVEGDNKALHILAAIIAPVLYIIYNKAMM